jgi:ketosteroid isomerase-like protein
MLGTLVTIALTAVLAAPQGGRQPPPDFAAFLTAMDAAQIELQNGRAAPYKALWSRADDVTLAGGLGGRIEKGWADVERRLDWVATQFSKGTNRIDRQVATASGDLGYVVQAEHIRYVVPGEARETTREYRVTMVFRREAGQWRIVHRQADGNTTKPPQ